MLPVTQQSQPSPSYTPGAAAPWAFNSRAGERPQGEKWYHFTLDHPKKLHPRSPGKLAAPSLIPSPQGCSPWRGGMWLTFSSPVSVPRRPLWDMHPLSSRNMFPVSIRTPTENTLTSIFLPCVFLPACVSLCTDNAGFLYHAPRFLLSPR